MEVYKINFAPRIKEARKRTGFTQKEVSEETGIQQSKLSKYENGDLEPNLETLGKLAEFYGVSTDWLLGITLQGARPNYDQVSMQQKKAM